MISKLLSRNLWLESLLPLGNFLLPRAVGPMECEALSVYVFHSLQGNYQRLIQKILDIFKPGQFLLTIFANKVKTSEVPCTNMD